MDRERRNLVVEMRVIRAKEDSPAKIYGHAAVFNELSEDLGGFREQILPGAFSEAIVEDDVRALWNHNPDYVLGRSSAKTLKLSEDEKGLAIEIDPPDTQFARDLMVSIERGDVSQMSFGFSVKPNGSDWGEGEDGVKVRTLKNVRLYDVSPVTFPAYPQTDVAKRSLAEWVDKGTPDFGLLRRNLDLMEIEV